MCSDKQPSYSPLNQLRQDVLLNRSVYFAEQRADRPSDFEESEEAVEPKGITEARAVFSEEQSFKPEQTCPFCPGNEQDTPDPQMVYYQEKAPEKWSVRVVPNKFPAVSLIPTPLCEEAAGKDAAGEVADEEVSPSCFQPTVSFGQQLVFIESRRHVWRASQLTFEELYQTLLAYQRTLSQWQSDERFAYGLIFKNVGSSAGASLTHLHSQGVALPLVPPRVLEEQQRAVEYYKRHAACPYCDKIRAERQAGKRIILEDEGFIAFCPYASTGPYETWIMPTQHQTHWQDLSKKGFPELKAFARFYQRVIRALESRLGTGKKSGYNMLLKSTFLKAGASSFETQAAASHWRIELISRQLSFAGFELATGFRINPLSPERAAEQLRRSVR